MAEGIATIGAAEGAVAMGFNSYVAPTATGSVAIGYGARALEADVFSVGKAMAAVCVLLLAERGHIVLTGGYIGVMEAVA